MRSDFMEVGRKRPGGRSAENLARIVEATTALLAERGYARLSIEEVAERAGVHRTTVHRRFPTRAALVAHTMAALATAQVPVPDTGTLAGDLLTFAREVRDATATPVAGALTRAVVAEGGQPGEMASVTAAFWVDRWERAETMITRAVARGELGDTVDARLVVELVVAPIHFRTFILGEAVDDHLLARIVTAVLEGAR